MSELMEWTTSIEVRSVVSGFKVGSTYPERCVNEEANGNSADGVRDECCVHRMRQRNHDIEGKEDDGNQDHHAGPHQDEVISSLGKHSRALPSMNGSLGGGFVLGRALL